MPHRIASLIAPILLISFCFSGCAYMSAQGRREMAYRHYVDKNIKRRQHQIAKAQKAQNRKLKHDWKAQPQVPSQPIVSSSTGPSDQMGAPMTVSSSDTTETPNTEPSP